MTRTHLPADESQRHLLPPPEGQTPEFDGVEDHLHGKVVGEPECESRQKSVRIMWKMKHKLRLV